MDNSNKNPAEKSTKSKWWDDLIPGRRDRNLFKDGEDESPLDKDKKFASTEPAEEGDEDYDDEDFRNTGAETRNATEYFEEKDNTEKIRK